MIANELKAKHRRLYVFIAVVLALALAGCRPLVSVAAPAAGGIIAGELQPTRTPFQAVPPTQTFTPTFTPPPTHTPLPTATQTPRPCDSQPGRIEQQEVPFDGSEAPFSFRVYTPPCFDPDGSARYPVLYMIHGQTYSDDQWERLGIGLAADRLIHSGAARPFLVVMPREVDTFADIYLSSFGRDVPDRLVPWIDSHYPTCAERSCRAIGGLSRGGAWALHLGFTRWEIFGAVGLHSTPPFNTDPARFPSWLAAIPSGQAPRVYMDSGRRDAYLSMSSAFEEQLTRAGVPHEWYLFNGMHDEEYWSAHVEDYLKWYARGWDR